MGMYPINRPLPKKIHELLIGYIFLPFITKKQRDESFIGFPAKNGWENNVPVKGLSISHLLKNPNKFIEDSDADIHISCESLTTKYQITRYVYLHGTRPHYSIGRLIVRKYQRQQRSGGPSACGGFPL